MALQPSMSPPSAMTVLCACSGGCCIEGMTSPFTPPLKGVRVVELTHTILGPSCGMILADLGAEVIKVEPVDGDRTRKLRGFGGGFFGYFNRNKKSLALDADAPEGRAVLVKLLQSADVLIENFAPGSMSKRGLGPEHLEKINPRLVYCALKGFLPGPYEKRPALDEVVQMMGGLAYMTGPTGRPLRAGTSVVDIVGGMFGAFGTVLALKQRERTGKGGLVESALFESVVFLMGQHLAITAMNGAPPPPMPERVSSWAIYEIFNTADGQQVFIGITSDGQWKRFCEFFKPARARRRPQARHQQPAHRGAAVAGAQGRRDLQALRQGRARAEVPRSRHLLRAGRAAAGPVRSSASPGQRLPGADHLAGRREDAPAAAAVPDAGLAAAAHLRSAGGRPAQ